MYARLDTVALPESKSRPALVLIGALIAVASALAGCASSPPTGPGSSTVAPGTWGGQHIALVVTSAQTSVQFDCAHGQIDAPIPLDTAGHFDVAGTFVLEQGGPVRPGQVLETRRARYTGSASGTTMSLSVSVQDPDENVGTFTLTLGEAGRLIKCL